MSLITSYCLLVIHDTGRFDECDHKNVHHIIFLSISLAIIWLYASKICHIYVQNMWVGHIHVQRISMLIYESILSPYPLVISFDASEV